MRHNIQTGNCAPAMLTTGVYPTARIEPAPTSELIADIKLNVPSHYTQTLRQSREAMRLMPPAGQPYSE
jgi:hypothetical protein